MTKVSVFGEQPTEQKELKKIEFVKALDASGEYRTPRNMPYQYDNVCLYCAATNPKNFDCILAWDNGDDSAKSLYLGHWNDGVV